MVKVGYTNDSIFYIEKEKTEEKVEILQTVLTS